VPGMACSARLFTSLTPSVWRFGAVTVADTRRDASIGAMADRLLTDAPGRFAVVGAGLGGQVAIDAAVRAPDRVLGLALLGASTVPDTDQQTADRERQLAISADGGYDALMAALFPAVVDRGNRYDHNLESLWAVMAREVGATAFCGQLVAAIGRQDIRSTLPQVGCPTAVIHGVGDQIVSAENAVVTASRIPDAQLTLIGGAGHLIMHERPAATAAAVSALLRRAWA
jgi:pimeloyl-ACP methyl ester carboxylesterase